MKNRYQEKLKKSAKVHHKNNRRERFSNGLMLRHQYDQSNLTKLSWGDDASCVLNDYSVRIAWIHPRMAFKNQAEDVAHEKVAHLESDFDYSLSQCEPIYAKTGKSRKRIVGHVMKDPITPSDGKNAFEAAYAEIVKTSNCQVAPYIKSQWVLGCRFVELCVPIEVRREQDLMKIVNLTRKLLKRETTLENEFHNYLYTTADWCLENLPLKLHS